MRLYENWIECNFLNLMVNIKIVILAIVQKNLILIESGNDLTLNVKYTPIGLVQCYNEF